MHHSSEWAAIRSLGIPDTAGRRRLTQEDQSPAAVLFHDSRHRAPEEPAPRPWPVALALTAATALGLLLGFAPRLVLSIVGGQPRTCSPKPVRPAGSSPSFTCSEGIS